MTATTPALAHESEVRSYSRQWPVKFDRALGPKMFDPEGREYLDFFSGAGALNYGHNHPKLVDAAIEHLNSGQLVHSLDMGTSAKERFMDSFLGNVLAPRDLHYRFMFPGPGGTNAVEAALKCARYKSGLGDVWSFKGAFHGMTLGALEITENQYKRDGAGPVLRQFSGLPFDNPTKPVQDSIDESINTMESWLETKGSPAAVVVECIQGEGGARQARVEWLRAVATFCRDHDTALIVDDIQAGCGRSGTFFSFEESRIRPDMICLSKSLSGVGTPMSLLLVTDEYDVLGPGQHNGTFRGNGIGFACGAVAAEEFWRDGQDLISYHESRELFDDFLLELTTRHSDHVSDVSGAGFLRGVKLADEHVTEAVISKCLASGVVVESGGKEGDVLKLMPPINIEPSLMQSGLDRLDTVLGSI